MSSLSLVLLVAVAGAQAAPRPPAGWVARALPAHGSGEWICARSAKQEWVVVAEQDHLKIAQKPAAAAAPGLPFTPALAAGEPPTTFKGLRAVAPVADGYLAGFARGEFGGGLYWFSQDGAKHLKISPLSASWFPENVEGIGKDGRALYVFQGLSHLAIDKGRVLKVQQESGGGWAGTVLADLGTAPAAVLQELAGTWLVASSDGVIRVTSRGTVERIWKDENLRYLYPNSIVRTSDGVVYIGLRAWVVRVTGLSPGPPLVELLTPDSCTGYLPTQSCPCQQAKPAAP
jgi:hypothetical protein